MQNLIIGIAGMKGYGKSTYFRKLLEAEPSLVVVDTLGEHRKWCPPCPAETFADSVEMLSQPPASFRWSFQLSPEHRVEEFNFLCRAAYMAGELTFAVEETDRYSTPQADLPGLDLLVSYGRHRLVNLVWVSRNLPRVSRNLTSQTDVFVLFRQQEPRYIEGLAERLTDTTAKEVQNLQRFHYLIASRDAEPQRGVVAP